MTNRGQGLLTLLRISVEASAAFFLTAALLDYGVGLTRVGRWMEHLQLVPAALSLSFATLVFWLGVTLLFGRIYCSTLCPLGALMDLCSRARMDRPYHYAPPLPWLRSLVLAVALIVAAISVTVAVTVFDPYEVYAAAVRHAWPVGLSSLISLAIVAVIAVVAIRRGRLICNTVCPVGTLLGAVAQHSAMRIDINTDRCIQCRRCEWACKSQCIDLQSHVVDMSRCVVCFDCLPVCPNDAITYTARSHRLSWPMMQELSTSTSMQCDNTSTSCKISSTTE